MNCAQIKFLGLPFIDISVGAFIPQALVLCKMELNGQWTPALFGFVIRTLPAGIWTFIGPYAVASVAHAFG